MSRFRIYSLLLFVGCAIQLNAQDKGQIRIYESQLKDVFKEVFEAPTDNERYHANETALLLLDDALMVENSIKWAWSFDKRVSVLTAPDLRFRIFTWPVVRDNGEWECFGFVQSWNEKAGAYDIYMLHDMREEIVNREESVLPYDNWLGSVYQELVTTHHEGKTFYTLLGWTGVDCLTQRKVIEPIAFKNNSSAPMFGQQLFRKEKNLRRIVLEYSATAMVALGYEEQYIRTIQRLRARISGSKNKPNKKRNRQEKVQSAPTSRIQDEKLRMIIFDKVEPQIEGMEGLYQYYVPSGEEQAYVFVNGKWDLRNGAQGRVANKKLNKEFSPLNKISPAYKVK